MRIVTIFSILIITSAALSSCLVKNTQTASTQPALPETQPEQVAVRSEAATMEEPSQPEIFSLILETPLIEYEGGNQLSEPIITGYNTQRITPGEEFILDPATLGFLLAKSVGAVKLKLDAIGSDSITVDVLADTSFDGEFHPREPVESIVIKDGTCIDALPLKMDVFYRYCFELAQEGSSIVLRYKVEGESTMPLP